MTGGPKVPRQVTREIRSEGNKLLANTIVNSAIKVGGMAVLGVWGFYSRLPLEAKVVTIVLATMVAVLLILKIADAALNWFSRNYQRRDFDPPDIPSTTIAPEIGCTGCRACGNARNISPPLLT